MAGANRVIENFVAQKKKLADDIGIPVKIYSFEKTISENQLYKEVFRIQGDPENAGIIIQLPLPRRINAQRILDAVDQKKDIDMLSSGAVGDFVTGKSEILPPVVGAVRELLAAYRIGLKGKHIVLFGAGRLVGRPIMLWLQKEGGTFTVVQRRAQDMAHITKNADILISGVGKPGIVTGKMIKRGVVLLDAGTSEMQGKLVGDIDIRSVTAKAAYLAPVPGGVGPLTVCMIFSNLLALAKTQNRAL